MEINKLCQIEVRTCSVSRYNANAKAARPTTAAAGPYRAAVPVLVPTAALLLMVPVALDPEVPVADPVIDAPLPEAVDMNVAGSAAMTP
jgi:hypothetical protein